MRLAILHFDINVSMEFMPFCIQVEGPHGPDLLTVLKKVIVKRDHIFALTVGENKDAGQMISSLIYHHKTRDRRKQHQSFERGPRLPSFYVEEICEQIT